MISKFSIMKHLREQQLNMSLVKISNSPLNISMLHKGLNPKYLIQASQWIYFAEVIKHGLGNEVLCLTVQLIIIRPHKTTNQQLLHEHAGSNLPRWFLCKNHSNNLSDPILDPYQANQVTSQINPRDQSKLISKQDGNGICIQHQTPNSNFEALLEQIRTA